MASLNLSSLSTFWQSAKSFFLSHFSDRTTLFSSNTPYNGDIQLSESLDNFKYFAIRYTTNDKREILTDYFTVDSSTNLLMLGFPQAGTTSNGAIYIKYLSLSIDSGRTNLTVAKNVEVRLRVSDNSIRNTEGTAIYVFNVWGYGRIS